MRNLKNITAIGFMLLGSCANKAITNKLDCESEANHKCDRHGHELAGASPAITLKEKACPNRGPII